MGEPNPPLAAAPPNNFTVGSTVVPSSTVEIAFALREEQFQVLCEGESGTDRSGRDLSIGLFFGVLVGIAGILATIDWEYVWKPEHRTSFFWSAAILILLSGGSLVGIVICCMRLYKTRHSSSYSRLKKRIEDFFKGNQSAL